MGLDMYLYYQGLFYGEETAKLTYKGKEYGPINSAQIESAYWRKVNQVHNWFVANVQNGLDNCHEYDVDDESIHALIDTCKRVISDPSLAQTLLPRASGFFFGSAGYDEDYFEQVQGTIDQLEKALKEKPDGWYFIYRSSW